MSHEQPQIRGVHLTQTSLVTAQFSLLFEELIYKETSAFHRVNRLLARVLFVFGKQINKLLIFFVEALEIKQLVGVLMQRMSAQLCWELTFEQLNPQIKMSTLTLLTGTTLVKICCPNTYFGMMLFVLLQQIDAQLGQVDEVFDFLFRCNVWIIKAVCLTKKKERNILN